MKMMGQAVAIGVTLGVGAASWGCGAAPAKGPEYAPAPVVVAEPPEEKSYDAAPASVGRAPPPPPAAPGPATVSVPRAESFAQGGAAGASSARSDFEIAERQLQSSAGDCATACRALGSMERATAHLCALASSSSDQHTCQDARAKVLAGRDRVRASCGDCPGGPSLDRNAPIPSTR